MTNYKKTIAIIAANTLALVLLIEAISYFYLQSRGVKTSFLFAKNSSSKTSGHGDDFLAIDPFLGYAHGEQGSAISKLSKNYTWVDGFVIYAPNGKDLARPVILTLGGSTTDGVQYGHSWPEHLARLMKVRNIPGTVVNGGTGGYSTNQELLKLVRDGLEFKPDLVISYSGINDRGAYSSLPHPMVHSYQISFLQNLIGEGLSPLLPSTVKLIKTIAPANSNKGMDYTLGIPTSNSLGEQYKKNIRLMNAISVACGSEFMAFIQPNGYFPIENSATPSNAAQEIYQKSINSLYKEIIELPKQVSYAKDYTRIFAGHQNVYKDDHVHVHDHADKIIANHILDDISGTLKRLDASKRSDSEFLCSH